MKWGPDYYNKVYRNYRIPFEPTRARVMANLCRGKTLDVGSGTCQYHKLFPYTLIALDISRVALKRAPRHISRVCACSELLPFRNECFDSVFASELLEHVDDDIQVLGELTRVLNPGGLLVASVPNNWLDPEGSPSHQRAYTFRSLQESISLFFNKVIFHKYSKANAYVEPRLVISGVKK